MVGSWLNSLNKSGAFLCLEEEQEKRETPTDTFPYWTRTWLCQVHNWIPNSPGRIEDLGEVVLEPNSYVPWRIWWKAFEVAWLRYSDDSENWSRAFPQPLCLSCVLVCFHWLVLHCPVSSLPYQWSRGSWRSPCWRVSSSLLPCRVCWPFTFFKICFSGKLCVFVRSRRNEATVHHVPQQIISPAAL